MRRRALLMLTALAALPARAAAAAPPELAQALPAARLQGEGRLSFFGLQVYGIRLWTPEPVTAATWSEVPLALELAYARKLSGEAIAERSIDEMRRQGALGSAQAESWLAAMSRLFPDVRDGDRLTGVYRPGAGASFFFNGQPRGELNDRGFARRFFGIWLAPQTSEPALRDRLLGTAR